MLRVEDFRIYVDKSSREIQFSTCTIDGVSHLTADIRMLMSEKAFREKDKSQWFTIYGVFSEVTEYSKEKREMVLDRIQKDDYFIFDCKVLKTQINHLIWVKFDCDTIDFSSNSKKLKDDIR